MIKKKKRHQIVAAKNLECPLGSQFLVLQWQYSISSDTLAESLEPGLGSNSPWGHYEQPTWQNYQLSWVSKMRIMNPSSERGCEGASREAGEEDTHHQWLFFFFTPAQTSLLSIWSVYSSSAGMWVRCQFLDFSSLDGKHDCSIVGCCMWLSHPGVLTVNYHGLQVCLFLHLIFCHPLP
jgi:hypothetical protein